MVLCSKDESTTATFSCTDWNSTFSLFNASLFWPSSSFSAQLSAFSSFKSSCVPPNSFLVRNSSWWRSVSCLSELASSSCFLPRAFCSCFSFSFISSLSLLTSSISAFSDSISKSFSLSSSWAACLASIASCNWSLRFDALFCWTMISSWSCWWPPRTFSLSLMAVVRCPRSSAFFSSKWALSAFNSSISLFFCSISFFAASRAIFCSTHCLLSFNISFLFESLLLVASSNWFCNAKLIFISFSYLTSRSDIFLPTSSASSRCALRSILLNSWVAFKSSRRLWHFDSSVWESRQSCRDILRSCSNFEIFALWAAISFSRVACRSLFFSVKTLDGWRESSFPSLISLSWRRLFTVVSNCSSFFFRQESSSWVALSFVALAS